jgi:hypothetical protein
MSGGEWAAAILGGVAALLVVLLLIALRSLTRAARALHAAAQAIQRETVPLVVDLRDQVQATTGSVERMGLLIEAAESVASTADSASRLAYATLGSPVVKSMAFGTGVARGLRRLTGRLPDDASPENAAAAAAVTVPVSDLPPSRSRRRKGR